MSLQLRPTMTVILVGKPTHDHPAKYALVSLAAVAFGVMGCLMSVLALGIVWMAPAVGPRYPPPLRVKRRSPLGTRPQGVLASSHQTMLSVVDKSDHGVASDQLPLLRRPASFPDLHTAAENTTNAARHVSFDLEFDNSAGANFPPSPAATSSIQYRCSSSISPFNRIVKQGANKNSCSSMLKISPHVQELAPASHRIALTPDQSGSSVRRPESPPEKLPSGRSLSLSMRLPRMRKVTSQGRRSRSDSCNWVNLHQERFQGSSPRSRTSLEATPIHPIEHSGELYRTGFVNPFTHKAKSNSASSPATLSLMSSPKCEPTSLSLWIDVPTIGPSLKPSPPPLNYSPASDRPNLLRRRLMSFFKPHGRSSSSSELPLTVAPSRSSSIIAMSVARARSKSVGRTQPYGPPWNAPMPGYSYSDSSGSSLDQHILASSRHNIAAEANGEKFSPISQPSRKTSEDKDSLGDKRSRSPYQPCPVSPKTFVCELDKRLSLLQKDCKDELHVAEDMRRRPTIE